MPDCVHQRVVVAVFLFWRQKLKSAHCTTKWIQFAISLSVRFGWFSDFDHKAQLLLGFGMSNFFAITVEQVPKLREFLKI
jgi:hypothetical protein